jgi:alkylated DNA repair protein alkB family protein 1
MKAQASSQREEDLSGRLKAERMVGCPSPSHTAEAAAAAGDGAGPGSRWARGGPGPPAEQLLRKLRWCTLGPQFDWTERVYKERLPHAPLPPLLHKLAARFASAVARLDVRPAGDHKGPAAGSPADRHLPEEDLCGESRTPWQPNVALVNYYREGDTLGGHRDDAEHVMDAPIVAISLGCAAIFLLGGVFIGIAALSHLCLFPCT